MSNSLVKQFVSRVYSAIALFHLLGIYVTIIDKNTFNDHLIYKNLK